MVVTIVWTCLIQIDSYQLLLTHLSPHSSLVCIPHLLLIFMDSATSSNPIIKKQEDDDKNDKRDIKPVPKTLNRVPRKLLFEKIPFLLCSSNQRCLCE